MWGHSAGKIMWGTPANNENSSHAKEIMCGMWKLLTVYTLEHQRPKSDESSTTPGLFHPPRPLYWKWKVVTVLHFGAPDAKLSTVPRFRNDPWIAPPSAAPLWDVESGDSSTLWSTRGLKVTTVPRFRNDPWIAPPSGAPTWDVESGDSSTSWKDA